MGGGTFWGLGSLLTKAKVDTIAFLLLQNIFVFLYILLNDIEEKKCFCRKSQKIC